MNSHAMPSSPAMPSPVAADALQSRYALRVAARLSERSEGLDPAIGERLRVAREQAIERARAARASTAPSRVGISGGALLLAGGWWLKVAAVVPAVALVAGLILIEKLQANDQIATATEIDAALLSDDLPPDAYRDAGFAEFLKSPDE